MFNSSSSLNTGFKSKNCHSVTDTSEVSQAERAKLNVVLDIVGRTLKIDTTPEEEKDEGATSASAVFNDIMNSQEDNSPLFG